LPSHGAGGEERFYARSNNVHVIDVLLLLTWILFFPWQMHHYFCAGDRVILVDDYYQFHDAFRGPLTPGDEGLIISCDIHSGVIRALVVVLGRKWYYDKRALRRAPANGGHTLSFGAGPAAGVSPFPPPGAAAGVGAPAAAASPGASGLSFGAGPAAGSPFPPPGAAAGAGVSAAASSGAGGFSFGAGPSAGSPGSSFGAGPAVGSPGSSFGAGPAAGSPGSSFGAGPAVAVNKPTPVRFNFPANF